MAIDKKLAQKAKGERYLKLETGISEGKRQEKAETEKMKNEMVDKIKEMQQKIGKIQNELEEERIRIEIIGSDIMELILKMECGGINEEERMKIEEKKTEKENEKMKQLQEFERKKDRVTKLMLKKDEVEEQLDLVKKYLIKYRRDVREKERRAIVELILSSEEEEEEEEEEKKIKKGKKEKKQRVSIVSNSLKPSRTFSNILKTSYVSLINICCFFNTGQ